jgi:hypothetical protein
MAQAGVKNTMNINSGLFLAGGDLIALARRSSVLLSNRDKMLYALLDRYDDIRFLSASPYGEYLAFWSITGESFRVIDLSGEIIWSCWMNTDKAFPHGIHFSTSDNAVACIYDFEGVPGLFFCDIDKQYATTFGCSGSPIGFDADLRYFVMDSCDPYEDEKLAFYEHDVNAGNIVRVPPAIVAERIKKNPLIIDRNRHIYPSPVLTMRRWDDLVVLNGTDGIEGFVILKDGGVSWLAKDTQTPAATVNDCLPKDKSAHEWYRCTLAACGDIALIQSVAYGGAIVVNRKSGVVWRGNDLSRVTLKDRRVLAEYNNGTIEVISGDGSIEFKYTPPSGFTTEAADIIDNILHIAYTPRYGGRLEVETFVLSGK